MALDSTIELESGTRESESFLEKEKKNCLWLRLGQDPDTPSNLSVPALTSEGSGSNNLFKMLIYPSVGDHESIPWGPSNASVGANTLVNIRGMENR